jgi:hypothetical protein
MFRIVVKPQAVAGEQQGGVAPAGAAFPSQGGRPPGLR